MDQEKELMSPADHAGLTSMTYDDLLDLLQKRNGKTKKQRDDSCSGVRSLLRALNITLDSEVSASHLAQRLRLLTPAGARMSKGRLQNCRSHMDEALAFVDKRFRRRRSTRPLPPLLMAFWSSFLIGARGASCVGSCISWRKRISRPTRSTRRCSMLSAKASITAS